MTLFIFSMCQGILLACICLVVEAGAGDFLNFEDRSNSLVKGCYHQNNSVALCFDIQRDFLKLTDKENKILVQYRRLPDQQFHAQVLDINFVWYVSYFFLVYAILFLFSYNYRLEARNRTCCFSQFCSLFTKHHRSRCKSDVFQFNSVKHVLK